MPLKLKLQIQKYCLKPKIIAKNKKKYYFFLNRQTDEKLLILHVW